MGIGEKVAQRIRDRHGAQRLGASLTREQSAPGGLGEGEARAGEEDKRGASIGAFSRAKSEVISEARLHPLKKRAQNPQNRDKTGLSGAK